jgi:hypothetical protein
MSFAIVVSEQNPAFLEQSVAIVGQISSQLPKGILTASRTINGYRYRMFN